MVQQTFEFDIDETGDYIIAFYANAAKNADFVLGQAIIQAKSFNALGIKEMDSAPSARKKGAIYDLRGQRVTEGQLKHGIYVIDGRKTVIK